MWMVNDELDVQHVIFTLLQEKDPGQDPGQTRGKNYEFSRRWVGLSALGNSRHCFRFKLKWWVYLKFCKIQEGNHTNVMRIYHLPQPITW